MLETKRSRRKLVHRGSVTLMWLFGVAVLAWVFVPYWSAGFFVAAAYTLGVIAVTFIIAGIAIGLCVWIVDLVDRWIDRGQ